MKAYTPPHCFWLVRIHPLQSVFCGPSGLLELQLLTDSLFLTSDFSPPSLNHLDLPVCVTGRRGGGSHILRRQDTSEDGNRLWSQQPLQRCQRLKINQKKLNIVCWDVDSWICASEVFWNLEKLLVSCSASGQLFYVTSHRWSLYDFKKIQGIYWSWPHDCVCFINSQGMKNRAWFNVGRLIPQPLSWGGLLTWQPSSL